MGRLTRQFGLCLILLPLVGAAMPLSGSAATPSEQELAHAIHFREGMGFRSEPDFVRLTFEDPAYSDDDWGTPLSAAESQELFRRSAVRPLLREAVDHAEGIPTSAGVYLDQRAAGIPVFLFVDDPERHRDAITSLLPEGVPYVAHRVDFTIRQLRATQRRVSRDMDALARRGLPVMSVAASVRDNRVVVGLTRETPRALERLARRYGPRVAVEIIGETGLDTASDVAGAVSASDTQPAVEPDWLAPLLGPLLSLPTLIWPDETAPASVAAFVPSVRRQLWDDASDGLRLLVYLRFVEARCEAHGPGVALIFEELRPPFRTTSYAYAARGSMPSAEDDGWSGGIGVSSVLTDSEFIHLMGSDTVPCA